MFRTDTQDLTTALVAQHQATLRHDARAHRLVRRLRRSRRAPGGFRLAGAPLNEPLL